MKFTDLILNLGSFLTGVKVVGKVEKDIQNQIYKIISENIKKSYNEKYDGEIANILESGDDIKILEPTGNHFSGAYALFHPWSKSIYIRDGEIEDIYETGECNNIVLHESIHKIQDYNGLKNPYKGKDIRGFIEGATEYMTLKAMGDFGKIGNYDGCRGEPRYNIPHTPYLECVSIMAQLGVIFGEEEVKEFAFGKNKNLLKSIKQHENLYEEIRKNLNAFAQGKFDYPIMYEKMNNLQNLLLQSCYQQKFEQVKTVADAEKYFSELKELDNVRAHFEGDTYFKDFYEEKYKECLERFPQEHEKLQKFQYKDIEFLNLMSKDDIIESLNNITFNLVCVSDNKDENIDRLKKVKRYVIIQDGTIHHLLVYDNHYSYVMGNTKNGLADISFENHKNDEEIKRKLFHSKGGFKKEFALEEKNDKYILKIDGQELELKEISLGITEEDVIAETECIAEYYKDIENQGLKRRIKNFFSRFSKEKALPPAHEHDSDIIKPNEFTDYLKVTGLPTDEHTTANIPTSEPRTQNAGKELEYLEDLLP